MPTKLEIKQEIINDPDEIGYASNLSIRNDSGILDQLLNPQYPTIKPTMISARTLLGEGAIGVSILEKFNQLAENGNAQAKWTIKFLNQETGIDIGNAAARETIDALEAGAIFTEEEEANLLRSYPMIDVSRSEHLWGRNITLTELSEALNQA